MTTKPKRRKRRSRSAVLAARTLTDIKAKKNQFLRDVSSILTDALGFPVRCNLVRVNYATTPATRKAARMTKAQARRQMADASHAPLAPSKAGRSAVFDDDIGF